MRHGGAGDRGTGFNPAGGEPRPQRVAPQAGWRPVDRLVHWLLPCPCLGCARPLPAAAPALGLCLACRGALAPPPAPACALCSRRLDAAAVPAGYRCGDCRRRPPPYSRLAAAWLYAPPLDAVILALKLRRLDYLGEGLGEGLAETLAERLGDTLTGLDAVVAVPLHWRRRLLRGYNQAERIARPLARRLGVPLAAALARRRATRRQTTLGGDARRRNLADAFVVRRRQRVAGRRLLLVDDVVTTGTTLSAAAECLRRAGAGEVVAVAAALAEAPRRAASRVR